MKSLVLEKIFHHAGHPLKLIGITDLPDINSEKPEMWQKQGHIQP